MNTIWTHGTRHTYRGTPNWRKPFPSAILGHCHKFPEFSLILCVFPKFPEFSLTGKLESHFQGFP